MKVAVIGAGIAGRLLAFSLVNARNEVSIFEQNDVASENCSMVAAGLLTPITELDKSEMIIGELGMLAIAKYWPAILDSLNDNIFFQQKGTLVVAHPKDQAETKRFVSFITNKLSDDLLFKKIDSATINQLEPELNKFSEAYFFSKEAQIDSQHVMHALKKYLDKKGVTWHFNSLVKKIEPGKILGENFVEHADIIFDCRGLGAKSIFNNLHSVRGELIWLRAPEVNINRPIRFLHPRYSLYVVPRLNNVYLIGASEISSSDHSEISVRTTLELLTAAYYLHPGFAEASVLKTVTQCRPTLSHYLPQIKYTNGLVAINGLYRHGYLIIPTLIAEIMQWLQHGFSALQYPQLWEQL